MFKGLRTVIYPVTDMARAKAWYSEVLECTPYFDEPYYAGFAVGGFELGLIPDGVPSADGTMAYWGVPDAAAELERLAVLQVAIHEELKEVGAGIKVASIRDPFGNLIGIIENPNFNLRDMR
jgi:predicted enzyme related to lactoylglutathione lyase